MTSTTTTYQPGNSPAGTFKGASWGEWLDRHSRTFFIAPAVILILIFAIFPTFYSIVFALSRVRFRANGLNFRFVWFDNFLAQFSGNEQAHFLGKLSNIGLFGGAFGLAVLVLALWWLYRSFKSGQSSWVGMLGRIISAAIFVFVGPASPSCARSPSSARISSACCSSFR